MQRFMREKVTVDHESKRVDVNFAFPGYLTLNTATALS
jgi:hypothetical protein